MNIVAPIAATPFSAATTFFEQGAKFVQEVALGSRSGWSKMPIARALHAGTQQLDEGIRLLKQAGAPTDLIDSINSASATTGLAATSMTLLAGLPISLNAGPILDNLTSQFAEGLQAARDGAAFLAKLQTRAAA
ncbi:MAG: hypothetical protein JWO69_800 [Thermoleophilia bacterium]|jgi:hypothetical protein|nr:hypothetical protein [Thermoleophilia bacterium]